MYMQEEVLLLLVVQYLHPVLLYIQMLTLESQVSTILKEPIRLPSP